MEFTIKGKISLPNGYDNFTNFFIQAFYIDDNGAYVNFMGEDIKTALSTDGSFELTKTNTNIDFPSKTFIYKVIFGEKVLKATKPEIAKTQIVSSKDIKVSSNLFEDSSKYTVKGKVINDDQTPFVGYVKVFDIHNGTRTVLCEGFEALTSGEFHISYTPETRGKVNLLVEVFESEVETSKVMTSPLYIDVQQIQEIYLKVSGNPFIDEDEFTNTNSKLGEASTITSWGFGEISISKSENRFSEKQVINYAKSKDFNDKINGTNDYHALLYGLLNAGVVGTIKEIGDNYTQLSTILTSAENRNAIPIGTSSRDLDNFKSDYLKLVEAQERDSDNSIFKFLFNLSTNPSEAEKAKCAKLVESILEHKDIDMLISNIDSNEGFELEERARIKNTIRASQVSSGNKLLINTLVSSSEIDDYDFVLEEIVSKDQSQWKGIIGTGGSNIPIPQYISGVDESPATETDYANYLMKNCEQAFPTEYCLVQWGKASELDEQEFIDLLKNNASNKINIRKTNFDTIVPKGTLRNEVKRIQRLFSITPNEDKAKIIEALCKDDEDTSIYNSAVEIVQKGKDKFVLDILDKGLSKETAESIYAMAVKAGFKTISRFASHSQTFNGLTTRVFDSLPVTNDSNIPNLEQLFKETSYCSCKHCRSVLSPAAYLVDILKFLNEIDGPNEKTLQTELFARRPDINNILLNCDNTNTAIPYVDLVNEVLESFIDPTVLKPVFNTKKSEDEISTYPEYLNVNAYDIIKAKNYPWHLPFNLWNEEINGYLRFVNVSKSEITEKFSDPTVEGYRLKIHLEFLGIDGSNYSANLERAYDTNNDQPSSLDQYYNGTHYNLPNNGTTTNIGLSRFLSDTCLELDDLKELLESKFINPNYYETGQVGAFQIVYGSNPCSMSGSTVNNMDVAGLDRFHRFVRLRNNLGWSTIELDTLLCAVKLGDPSFLTYDGGGQNVPDSFTNDLMAVIYSVTKLSKVFNIPITDALSLKYDLHAISYGEAQSPFDNVFNNPYQPKIINEESGYPYNITEENNSQVWDSYLQAALNLDADSLSEITTFLGFTTGWSMSAENLCKLYRFSYTNKVMRLSVNEIIRFCKLSDIQNPFDLNSNNEFSILDFISEYKELIESNFTLADLEYLLLHNEETGADCIPDQDGLLNLLTKLHTTRKEFEMSYPPFTVDYLEFDIPVELSDTIIKTLSTFFNADESLIQLLLKDILRRDYNRTVTEWNIQDNIMLTSTRVLSGGSSLLELYESEDFFNLAEVSSSDEFYKGLLLLSKVVSFVSKLGMETNQLITYINILENFANIGWYDIRNIPLYTPTQSNTIYKEWYDLNGITLISNKFFSKEVNLFEIISNPTDTSTELDWINNIAESAGWNLNDLTEIVSFLPLTNATDYQKLAIFKSIVDSISIVNTIKAPASTISSWNDDNESDIATSIRLTLKSHYNTSTWVKLAQPLRNQLREKQQAALINYLINNLEFKQTIDSVDYPLFRSTIDIYNYFLLDPEMSSCAKTTRIKQAGLSVQLLMQRVEMNLEEDCTLTYTQIEEWEWMKNYRVWEANRKVFLYPENWLEPEFRMNKTPFCKELEEGIIQNEINEENVSRQYIDYIEKFCLVANMEPMGMYVEDKDPTHPVIHLVSRTRKSPHIYFYRSFVNKLYWTPWDKITVDIEGESVIPVFWNNKFYLYWATMNDYEVKDGSYDDKKTKKMRDINIYWTSYSNGKWAGKNMAKEKITCCVDEFPSGNKAAKDMIVWATEGEYSLEFFASVRFGHQPWVLFKPKSKLTLYKGGQSIVTVFDPSESGSNAPSWSQQKINVSINFSNFNKFQQPDSWFPYYLYNAQYTHLLKYDPSKQLEYVMPLQYINTYVNQNPMFPFVSEEKDKDSAIPYEFNFCPNSLTAKPYSEHPKKQSSRYF